MCGVSLCWWCTIGAFFTGAESAAMVVDHRDHIGDVTTAANNSATEIFMASGCFFIFAPLTMKEQIKSDAAAERAGGTERAAYLEKTSPFFIVASAHGSLLDCD
jgi:hypothetical protein